MKVVKLACYDEFHCIGPECPETCCQQWEIFFSRKEYLDYKHAKCSPELKKIISNSFKRIKNENSENSFAYAKIKFKENGLCPMLSDDGLCMIQKELGEKSLCFVCSTFPRLHSLVGNDVIISSINMTCPHVVEVLMKHPEGLSIVEEEYDKKNRYINAGHFSNFCIPETWEGYPFIWTIKNAQIDILQNRNFSIPERLLTLGFFCQKAENYIKAKEGERIQGLANMLLDNEMYRKIADSLKPSQTDDSAAAKSVDILCKMRKGLLNNNYSTFLISLFNQATDSIGLNIQEKDDGIITVDFNYEKYFKNIEIYRQIEHERPYILENLLVNLILTQNVEQGSWINFFELAVFYNTLKIFIPAFLKEDRTDRDLAIAITNTTKIVINSQLAKFQMSANFLHNNSFDLPHAAFLIS